MANNIRELRLAFLLTPSQMAERVGIDVDRYKQLESGERDLKDEWVEAVSRAFGVPKSVITDPGADVKAAAENATAVLIRPYTVCRIGARYAIEAMTAKLGGLKIARELSEEELAAAAQNLISYTEDSEPDNEEDKLNRLSQCLQIVVLTILQSRGVDPTPDLSQSMAIARDGALSMLQSFSQIDQIRREREKE